MSSDRERNPQLHTDESEFAEQQNITTRLVTVAGLAVVAVAGYEAQRYGITQDMAPEPKLVVDSLKHPLVGYIGAWTGSIIAKKFAPDHEFSAIVAGATVANFGTETGQSALIASDEYQNFLAPPNLYETIKDYVFALGGCLLFRRHSRQRSAQ